MKKALFVLCVMFLVFSCFMFGGAQEEDIVQILVPLQMPAQEGDAILVRMVFKICSPADNYGEIETDPWLFKGEWKKPCIWQFP